MARPHGHAKVSRSNPQAWGVCDSCGFLYNLRDLRFQYGWAGARVQRINFLHCDKCTDKLQEQLRVIVLPADPEPVEHPRPERDSINNDPINTIALTFGVGQQPLFGTLTQGAGLRSAFDANPEKPFGLSAVRYISINGDNTIGRNWQGIFDNNQGCAIVRMIAYAPLNGRFLGSGPTPWRFEGSNDGVTFTAITSGTTSGAIGEVIDQTFFSQGYFLYHRFVITGDGISTVSVALLRLFQNQNTEPVVPSPAPGPIPSPVSGYVPTFEILGF